ncbi:MAG: Nif11-like leader peptide family natural product precursor [Crocosphaera sp.]
MSIQSVKEFYELLQSDETLQERIKAADDSATVVQIASEMGYEFTEQELDRAMQEAMFEGELSEQELESIAGTGKHCSRKSKNCK